MFYFPQPVIAVQPQTLRIVGKDGVFEIDIVADVLLTAFFGDFSNPFCCFCWAGWGVPSDANKARC